MFHDYQIQLSQLAQQGLRRSLKEIQSPQGRVIVHDGQEYLNFSSNNYLGLADDPRIRRALMRGVEDYGVGAGAARLVNGSLTPFHELERALAEFKGSEAALLFNSGYQANVGLLGCLLGEGDVFFSDELNHASIIDGLRLSKAKKIIFPHGDVEFLKKEIPLIKKQNPNARLVIVTESVFSMDGKVCPLQELLDLSLAEEVLVYLDEAHGTGVFGKSGAGVAEDYRDHPAFGNLIQMGTLGKALGCFGAYVATSQLMVDFFMHRARSFVYATALPPAMAVAALEALSILQTQPYRHQLLWQRLEFFAQAMEQADLPVKIQSPIIPLIVGAAESALALSEALSQRGYWVNAIRPPTVPEGTARLRVTLMATHTEEDIRGLVGVFKEALSLKPL